MIAELSRAVPRSALARISVQGYHRLFELGALTERTELLDGIVFRKMPKSPQHTRTVEKLFHKLMAVFPGRYIRKEEPLTIGNSEPEPDLALCAGKADDYNEFHPTTAELVIEVSKSTYDLDRDKRFIYARAGIPEYWLFDLDRNQVEIYGRPVNGEYSEAHTQPISDPLAYQGQLISLSSNE